MAGRDRPENRLEMLRDKLLRDQLPSDEEYRMLLTFCSHPGQQLREVAHTLLLHPPVTDILSAYRNLLKYLATGRPKLRELPLPLCEMLCEFVAVRGQIPLEPAVARFFEDLVKHLPPALMRILLHQSLPLQPFLANLRVSSFGVPSTYEAPALKRRWRLLRKKLSAVCGVSSWAQLTFADLGGLFSRKPAARRLGYSSGRWLVLGRPLILRQATTYCPSFRMPFQHCRWGSVGVGARRYLDRLLSAHVEELRTVRALAQTVSHDTGRVVLSWHNATLAASSGWAFDDLRTQFPGQALWETYKEAVQRRFRNTQGTAHCDPKAVRELGDQWQRRLVIPKVYHALWEDRVQAALGGTGEAEWQEHGDAVQDILRLADLGFAEASKGYGWAGPVSPHQHLVLDDILNWTAWREGAWHNGLLRLVALLQEGQSFLDRGLLPHLVLPWIDKFFISSRREADWKYLTGLVDWLAGQGTRPLILFWEDTPHAQEPSLKLVLKWLHGQGYPFRGIGVFDWQGSSRPEALKIICREHHQASLFALRPYRDCHNFHSFRRLLEDCPYAFFQDYDSSWKDGLCFFYAGTQVFPLLSVPTDRENVPAWIAGAGVKYPFGSYWRDRLREAVSERKPEISDVLSVTYAMWANLC